MSIAKMASGDTVVKQSIAYTTGGMGGNKKTVTDGSAIICNVQTMSVQETLSFDARGEKKLYNVFFASDPLLGKNNQLKWTKTNGNNTTFATPRILKVLATEEERNPKGTKVLYIAKCELETTERLG